MSDDDKNDNKPRAKVPTGIPAIPPPVSGPELSPEERDKLRAERAEARRAAREREAAAERATWVSYVYSGPLTAVTLDGAHFTLAPGAAVKLPPENRYTQSLLARGYLRSSEDVAKAKARAQKGRN